MLHEQAWVAVFHPALSTITFEIEREDMKGLSTSVATYILSNCPESPEDQILKTVQINVHLGFPPEGTPDPPVPSEDPSCEKLRQKCALFLERGEINVSLVYDF